MSILNHDMSSFENVIFQLTINCMENIAAIRSTEKVLRLIRGTIIKKRIALMSIINALTTKNTERNFSNIFHRNDRRFDTIKKTKTE